MELTTAVHNMGTHGTSDPWESSGIVVPMPHRHRGPGRGAPPSSGPHRHRHSLSSLAHVAQAPALEDALRLVVPDPRDRAFVARCILGEGPAHHRAASWALVALAAEVARRVGAAPREAASPDDVVVPLRLPPHLAEAGDDGAFPLPVPLGPLRAIARGEREVEVLADALVDGPPHHALANAALVALFGRILAALGDGEPAPR